MKKLIIILLLLPLSSFAQSNDMIDSVNHYFSILLNNERDSINQYNVNDKSFKKLNSLKVETDSSKFVNPIKHIDKIITKIKLGKSFYPHTTTNYENTHVELKVIDFGDEYSDPKKLAKDLFNSWKGSYKHYIFMVNGEGWVDFSYNTFKVLYKVEYYEIDNIPRSVLVATYTGFGPNLER